MRKIDMPFASIFTGLPALEGPSISVASEFRAIYESRYESEKYEIKNKSNTNFFTTEYQ